MNQFQKYLASLFGVGYCDVYVVANGVNKNLRVISQNIDVFARFSPTSLHSKKCLEYEANLLTALNAFDVPCCEPFDIDGTSVIGPVTINEIEYGVFLNQTIHGPKLNTTSEDANYFGRSLAHLHRTSVEVPINKLLLDTNGKVHSTIRPVFNELTDFAETLSENSQAKSGVCHGDAWLGNAIKKNGRAVLFDFEFAGTGELAYDIATFIWALRAENNAEEALIFKSFVEGYRAEYDVIFSEEQLKVNFLRKEISNIRFLCENIEVTPEISSATVQFARETLDFILKDYISQFRWN